MARRGEKGRRRERQRDADVFAKQLEDAEHELRLWDGTLSENSVHKHTHTDTHTTAGVTGARDRMRERESTHLIGTE